LPDGSTTTSHTTANSTGQYLFGPFTETQPGVYSEVDSDDTTGGKSYAITWNVSPATLPAPTLAAPANGATGVSDPPTFSWTAVSGASSYRILVATSSAALPSDPTSSTCSGCVINATPSGASYTPAAGTLTAGTTYYWEVHARSSADYGTWSSVFNFTMQGSLLSAPTLTAPVNGATNVGTTPTFSWSNVTGNAGYRIMVATSSSALPRDPTVGTCTSCTINITVGTSVTSYTPGTALSVGTTYYWQVHALTPPSNPGYYYFVKSNRTESF
jgi:hypothetical protein